MTFYYLFVLQVVLKLQPRYTIDETTFNTFFILILLISVRGIFFAKNSYTCSMLLKFFLLSPIFRQTFSVVHAISSFEEKSAQPL